MVTRFFRIGGFGILLALCNTFASAAQLIATADRHQITRNEQIVVTLSLVNSDTRLRAEGVSPNVDLTLLSNDFEVGSAQKNFRYNASRHRARASSELTIQLFPRREGELTIPAFTIDDASSAPISISVLPPPDENAPLVFSEAGTVPATGFNGQQIVAYLDLYYRKAITSAKLGGDLETEPTALDRLEHYRLPNSERKEKRNGFEYTVFRSAWAIFAPNEKTLELYFPDIWIVLANEENRRLPGVSRSLSIDSLPLQAANLPVGRVDIDVSETVGANNESATWQITLTGPIRANALPRNLDVPNGSGYRIFHGEADISIDSDANGVVSIARYTLTALSGQPTSFTLPPLIVEYFDPTVRRVGQSRYDFKAVNLAGGSTAPLVPTLPTTTAPGPWPTLTVWKALASLFFFAWLTTLWALFIRRRRNRATVHAASNISVSVSHCERPLLARLTRLLGSSDIEHGIALAEADGTDVASLRQLARAIQRYYFSADKAGDAAELSAQLENWETRLEKRVSGKDSGKRLVKADPWNPRAMLTGKFNGN